MCKVLSKKVYKLPKGVTTIYEIESNYFGSQSNFLYSRTVLNSGKISVYNAYVSKWKHRKYKYYANLNFRRYKDIECAVKEYENQLT